MYIGSKTAETEMSRGIHRFNTAFTHAVLQLATSPNEGQQD